MWTSTVSNGSLCCRSCKRSAIRLPSMTPGTRFTGCALANTRRRQAHSSKRAVGYAKHSQRRGAAGDSTSRTPPSTGRRRCRRRWPGSRSSSLRECAHPGFDSHQAQFLSMLGRFDEGHRAAHRTGLRPLRAVRGGRPLAIGYVNPMEIRAGNRRLRVRVPTAGRREGDLMEAMRTSPLGIKTISG